MRRLDKFTQLLQHPKHVSHESFILKDLTLSNPDTEGPVPLPDRGLGGEDTGDVFHRDGGPGVAELGANRNPRRHLGK